MKKIKWLVVISLLAGCAGHAANPVMVNQFGDQDMSCKQLRFEMDNAQGEMSRLAPQTDKTGQNVALGVAGAFLLVPWFFMDFKNGEHEEYDAWRQRYNHLGSLALGKNCHVDYKRVPSVEEMQEQYKKAHPDMKKVGDKDE